MTTQGSVASEAPVADIATEQATVQPTTPAEAPTDPYAEFRGKKFKIKVDKNEEEVDFESLLKSYPKAKSADKRFMEAAQIRKSVDQFVNSIRAGDDYSQLIEIMGKEKAEKFAENLLLEKINWETATPEQRKLWEFEQENKRLKNDLSARERAKLEADNAQIRTQAITEIDTEITEALSGLGKKPTPRLIARIAEEMLASLELESQDDFGNPLPVKRLPAKDAMSRVLSDFKAELEEYMTGLSVEEVRKVLPKSLLDGLRKAQVDDVITPFHQRSAKTEEPKQKTSRKTKNMPSNEWFAAMEKKFKS